MAKAMMFRVLACSLAATVLMLSGCEHKPPSGGGAGASQNFEIQIETTHNTLQGMHVIVDVTLNSGYYRPTGFDLKLVYNAQVLCFMAAIPGDLYTICDWEYFSYQYELIDTGFRGGTGAVWVKGIADVDAWNLYTESGCEIERVNGGPLVLFSIDFVVSNDPQFECIYLPIRFYWEDCDDNVVTYSTDWNRGTDIRAVAKDIFDYDLIGRITDDRTGFPTFTGFQHECYESDPMPTAQPVRLVDFINGGVDIVCADSVAVRGDIDLDGWPFEITDLVLFVDFFNRGLEVFNRSRPVQIAATDVNGDGRTLTSSDLVYMVEVMIDNALPLPLPEADSAHCSIVDGVLLVDQEVAAAQVVLEGEVDWTSLADHTTSRSRFEGGRTYVLILGDRNMDVNPWLRYTFSGPFLQTEGEVIAIDMSTVDGAWVDVTIEEH